MKAYFFFIAICTGFFTANAAGRYAVYKAALGPEEELDKALLKLGTLDGMAFCRAEEKAIWFVRVLAIILWVLTACIYGEGWLFLLYGLCISLLLGLSYVDIKINELPPLLNAMIAFLGVIRAAMDLEHWYTYLIGAVAVSGLFLLIGILSKGRAMGGGDVKLMAALGLLLGWQKILLVLLVGAVSGTLIHGLRMLIKKDGHALAFGPYLAAGAVVAMLWGDRLISMYLGAVLNR